ncbi:hypothetical protein Tco_1408351 [Tanacetum coccineum]
MTLRDPNIYPQISGDLDSLSSGPWCPSCLRALVSLEVLSTRGLSAYEASLVYWCWLSGNGEYSVACSSISVYGLAVELSPISYLERIVDKCNLLRGGLLRLGEISSLTINRWIGKGKDRVRRRPLQRVGDSGWVVMLMVVVMARGLSTSASGEGIWKSGGGGGMDGNLTPMVMSVVA